MRLACPACGKQHPSAITAAPTCDRCGCDLSELRAVLGAAAALLRQARAALRRGDWEDALWYASRSWTLEKDPRSVSVACLAAAALGEVTTLERWRGRDA